MRVLLVEPQKAPYVKEVERDLESLQAMVGGYIQAVYPYTDPIALICNDDGKLIGLPPNRALYDDNGEMYDIVVGTFLIVGLSEESFADLSPELLEKYQKLFAHPQIFIPVGDEILAIPMNS